MQLMKCGHVENAVDEQGRPCCAICTCFEVDREVTESFGLEGRKAKCVYNCGHETDSAWTLPFFEYTPNKPYDMYYCGCWGWD